MRQATTFFCPAHIMLISVAHSSRTRSENEAACAARFASKALTITAWEIRLNPLSP